MIIKFPKLIFSSWLFFIFAIAILFWYSPVLFKGYPAQSIDSEGNLTAARNYAQSGVFGSESDLNVVVAPSLAQSQVAQTLLGNKLTIFSYAGIFKALGQLDWDKIILLVIIIHALALVFFSITIFYLFGLKEAIIFSIIYILLPINWQTVYFIGTYEFAILFFSIFTVLFFCFRNHKYKVPFLILSGLFLALAGLAREAMFLSFPVIFLWLLANKKKKDILLVFIPLIIVLAVSWAPDFLRGNNEYLKLFVSTNDTNKNQHSDFQYYGHLFPDPYTYYFNKESVLKPLQENIDSDNSSWFYRIGMLKAGANMGIRSVNIIERFIVGTTNFSRQISKFLSLEDIGGPFIFILMLLGLYQLKNKNREIYFLFISLMIAIPLLLSYVVLGRRSHLMDFSWIIAGLVSLGLTSLYPLFKNYYQFNKHLKLFYCFIIILVFYSLILANHVYLGQAYDSTKYMEIRYLADKINTVSRSINDSEVIAVSERGMHPAINYLTNKSVVFFSPNTIAKLIKEGGLQKAFEAFGVKYVIGYDQDLSELITENSQVKNISIWPEKSDLQAPLSYNKSWLLNLVK